MCGIVGGTGIDNLRVAAAMESISHRGPDARAVWRSSEDDVTLGHLRLSIIDLSAKANQPMKCTRTRNVVVFNGEIYNFRSLRSELEHLGWHFLTRSDTEVLLASYEQWGPDCLMRLNGMFALAIYDAAVKRIFLARDRLGKKPLYYAVHGRHFVWASELKAILALLPDLSRSYDLEALAEYVSLGYVPGRLSILQNVRRLPPAHYMTFDIRTRALEIRRYWELPEPISVPISEGAALERMEEVLTDAVRIRLESDVPVGLFLSGGIDSGLVAAIAVRQKPDLVAYTARSAVERYDEAAQARATAEHIGMNHRLVDVLPADISTMRALASRLDEPLGDPSLLPTYLVSRAIREHVKVALSGDGGDELFAGYGYYPWALREVAVDRVPRVLRRVGSRWACLFPRGARGRNFLARLETGGVERFLALTRWAEAEELSFLALDLREALRNRRVDDYRRRVAASMPAAASLLQKMTRIDFLSFLPDDVLVKVDRASMLCSLEVRSPFLDYRVVELAFTLPDDLRVRDGSGKYLLKALARKYLPTSLDLERKRGFNIPEAEWLRDEWRELVEESVRSRVLDPKRVNVLQRFHDRSGRYARALFKAMMLASFHDTYCTS